MSDQMTAAINKQINAELYSSYLYLSMSAWFEDKNLTGLAKWMRAQAAEEHAHAMKFLDHLVARGARVKLAAIDAPPSDFTSPLAVFEEVLKHEQKVTAMIHDLAGLADAQKDRAAAGELQWFIKEQVEEEATAGQIVAQFRMVKDSVGGLFQLDHHLGKR